MDLNKLTQKSQEAVQQAQAIALRYGHQEVDGEHLLASLLAQDDGLFPRMLTRMQVDGDVLKSELDKELARLPKVSGPGVEQDKEEYGGDHGERPTAHFGSEDAGREIQDQFEQHLDQGLQPSRDDFGLTRASDEEHQHDDAGQPR